MTYEDDEIYESEEYGDTEPEEDEETEEEEDTSDEPSDLADAFARYREAQREGAEEAADEGGDNAEEEEDEDPDEDSEDYLPDDGDGGDSEIAEVGDDIDATAALTNFVQDIQRQAIEAARQDFSRQGIRQFSVRDLYSKDDRGRAVYQNPDDPDRPFANRMEAQSWVNSINEQIQQEMVQVAQKHQEALLKSNAPSIRLLQFYPTYRSMDPVQREVLDDLIEDYEIKKNGKVVGYSCDLDRMARTAARMAKRRQDSKPRRGRPKKRDDGPSLDMRTKNSSTRKKERKEPRDLSEAMQMYNEMHKNQQ